MIKNKKNVCLFTDTVGEYRSVRFLAFKVLLNVSKTTICTGQLIRFHETISFILRSRGRYPLNGLVFIQRTCCNTSDTTEKRKFLLCGIASLYRELLSHKHSTEGRYTQWCIWSAPPLLIMHLFILNYKLKPRNILLLGTFNIITSFPKNCEKRHYRSL